MGRLNILAGIKLDNINGLTKEVQNELDKVSKKVSLNIDKVNLNNIDKSINELKNRVDSISNKIKISPDFDNSKIDSKISNFENKVITMQSKLKSAFDGGFINESELQKLQQNLNNLNVDTPVSEFRELQLAINNLGKSENQIVRLDKIINQLESNLKDLNSKKSIDLMTESELSQLNEAKKSLEQLKTLKSNIEGGNAKSTAQISNAVNEATRSMSTFENSIISSNKSAGGLVSTFKNIASYAIGGSIIYGLVNEVKEGISTIVSLDTAMRDLRKVSSATTEELSKFTDVANKIGIEIGASTRSVIEATTYYSKLGYAIDEASKRAKNATVFSNVADMSIDEASKSLITIQKGFNLNTLEDMTRIMDVANEVGNNYSSTSEDIANGLRQMGNAMAEAGNSYEQSVGIFVAGNASIQDSEKVGNAIKTISMRLRGMKTEIDETSIPVSKLRDTIKQLSASVGEEFDIMIDDNTFKSTYNQMVGLQSVYYKLSDSQRAYLQYLISGQRQGNIFSGIMSNMTEGVNAYNTALNSSGSAQREQALYLDSIEGRVNAFKETLSSIWVSLISSEDIKSIVSGGTMVLNILGKIIDVFGGIPTVVAIATGSIVAFNKTSAIMKSTATATESMSTAIGKYGLTAKKTTVITNGVNSAFKFMGNGAIATSVKTKVLDTSLKAVSVTSKIAKVAVSSIFSAGLSLVITGVITAIGKFATNLYKAEKSMEDSRESAKALSDTLSQMKTNEKLLSDYSDVSRQIEDINTSETRRNELNQKLGELKEQISSIDDRAYGIINDQNKSYEEQVKLLEDINSQKLFKQAEDVDKTMVDQSSMEQKAKGAMALLHSIEQMEQKISSLQGVKGSEEEIKGLTEAVNKFKNDLKSIGIEVGEYNSNVNLMNDANYKTSRSTIDLDGNIEKYINSLSSSTDAINENTLAKKENGEVQFQHMSEEDALETLKSATQEYGKANDEAKKLRETIAKINSDGLTTDTITQLADQYSDLGYRINDVGEVQEYLNNKLQEQVESAQSSYSQMIANDSEFYQSKIANNENFNNIFNDMLNQVVANSGEAYNVDLSNFTNLQDLKSNIQNQFGDSTGDFLNGFVGIFSSAYSFDASQYANLQSMKEGFLNQTLGAVENWIGKYTTGMAQSYGHDLRGFQSLSEAKTAILEQLNSKLKVLQGNYENLFNSVQKAQESDPTITMNRALHYTKTQINEISSAIGSVDRVFSGLETSLGRYTSNFKASDFKGKDIGSSNTGGGSKSKKSPSSSEKAKQTEKDVADLKKMTNAYHDVERALDLVNHKLNINKSLQDGATEKQKLKYMKDEVKLYKEKQSLLNKEIKLYEKEQASLKKTLLKNDKSFKFDKSGNITNYNDIMKAWVKKANSLTGKAKEKYIDQVKKMQEYVERYEDITHQTLYGLKEDWKDLNNSIKEVLEEQNRIIMDAKQKAYDDVVWQIDTQQGNYFEYKLKLLDEDDVQGKVEIMNTQLENQNKILQASRKYLEDLYAMGLKPTDAGYEDWIERLKEAEQEFHNQRMEFESMKDSLEDLVKNQMTEYINQLKEIEQIEMDKRHQQEKIDLEKKYFDTALAEYNKYKESKIKSLNEEIEAIKKKLEVEKGNEALLDILKSKQLELNELQNEQYEKITSWYELEEKMHNANIDAIDKELNALEEKNKLEEENEERLKRQNELIEIQQRMQNIKKNKNIRELTKNDKGEFDWDYTYDRKALADANKEYKEKQEDLAKWEKDLELEKYKEKLNQQKEYEQEALALLKAQYDKALALLEEKQTKESEVMDKKYEDMLEDTDKYLEDMLTKYDGSWTKIIEVLGLKLEEGNLQLDSFAQTTIATIDNLSAYIDSLYSKLEGLKNIDISSSISEGFTNPVVPNLPVVNSLSKTTSTTSNVYNVNANFPNATDSSEIEKSLLSIGDNATQHIKRRK